MKATPSLEVEVVLIRLVCGKLRRAEPTCFPAEKSSAERYVSSKSSKYSLKDRFPLIRPKQDSLASDVDMLLQAKNPAKKLSAMLMNHFLIGCSIELSQVFLTKIRAFHGNSKRLE